MFLSMPFLAVIYIICSHIDSLQPYAFLISTRGSEKHTITLAKIRAFFGKADAKRAITETDVELVEDTPLKAQDLNRDKEPKPIVPREG